MIRVLWSAREWARALAALPAGGPLPARTALVPGEAVAHALRRELVEAGLGHALAGTRFVPVAVAACEVLAGAGVAYEPGEDARRAARLDALFRRGLPLEHFPIDLLRSHPGWGDAFARTLRDLELSGLQSGDLEHHEDPRIRDVAAVRRAADESAGRSWTMGRIYREAAAILERSPAAWPYPGPVLAAASGTTSAVEARFLRAIPGAALGLLAARPLREPYLRRIEALFGSAAARALSEATAPRAGGSERDLLASYFFEPPAVLADPARPRSDGPDGSVDLEEHAGVEAEVEAAADWVTRQVLDGTPLEQIAVLVPALDPLAALVAERLARLPWHDGPLPVHVAGGLPLAGTAGGARALAVVRALRAHLAADSVAAVLPALRTAAPDDAGTPAAPLHLSHGAAMELVWSLGTVGGNPAHPEGAHDWSRRAAEREGELEAQLARARAAGEDAEQAGLARNARQIERTLADLRAARPAIDALVGVARVAGASTLAETWPALRDFLAQWLLQPGEGPRVHALLDEHLAAVAGDATCGGLAGDEALRLVEEAIASMRVPVGRFGEPAVYVGAVEDAADLPFRAVRVIGLAEGHLPAAPREDPVVPDALRARLGGPGAEGRTVPPATAGDRTLASLHALDRVVRNAGARVALSTPRVTHERSQREPSSILLEAAAALARPDAATGERAGVIPDTAALRRDAFAPARAAASAFRVEGPIGEPAWQEVVALGAITVPDRWHASAVIDPARVAVLARIGGGALDGILTAARDDAGAIPVPGLAPDAPLSASALQTLLECPYRFLLSRLLYLEEPAAAPEQREIGQPAYGALVHAAAEAFYREHGERFAAREGNLGDWLARADAVCDRAFDDFLQQYPLAGGAVRAQQRARLRADVRDLLEHDWHGPRRRFVAVERPFGWAAPIALPAGERSLFVRGRLDRLDVEGDTVTLVRDLKTGRPHPRTGPEAGPTPALDIQLAVYGLVAAQLAREWGVPARIAAAYLYVGRRTDERAWRDDFHATLEPAARDWLALAADLLAARAFPPTPVSGDCKHCGFRAVCGDEVGARSARLLANGDPLLVRFARLKGLDPENADPAPPRRRGSTRKRS